MTGAGLHLQQVCLRLGERELVPPLTLHIAPGEVAVVMGDSGSGKSSLLAWLAGVLAPPLHGRGELWLDGEALSGWPVAHSITRVDSSGVRKASRPMRRGSPRLIAASHR